MTPDQISSALAELIAVTTGWTEEAYEVYEKALGELEEPVALAKGRRGRHWPSSSRLTASTRPPSRWLCPDTTT
jgi:hypothetical protein